MSWSPDLYIGELRPWPDTVHVVRGKTEETRRYVPELTCHPIISDNLNESEGMGDAWANCSECGHLLFVLTDPTSEPPNFCPSCGARRVDA